MSQIRVFRHGKGTMVRFRYPNSKAATGSMGVFLPDAFATIPEAVEFCRGELKRDPSQFLHVVDDDVIFDTIYDKEFQARRKRRNRFKWMVYKTSFFAFCALGFSSLVFPNHLVVQFVFTLLVAMIFLLIDRFMGPDNLEGCVAAFVLFLLVAIGLGVVVTAIKKKAPTHSSTVR